VPGEAAGDDDLLAGPEHGVTIRPARAGGADLDALVRLFEQLHALQVAWRLFEPRPDLLDEIRSRYRTLIDDPDARVLIAESAGQPVGMAIGTIGAPSSVSDEPALIIANLVVDPEQRGRGIGRALVDELARFAHRRGVATLTIRTFAANHDAYEFWAGLGFLPLWVQMVRKNPDPSGGSQ
jgi:GNAT superfamily N-acetyltransferase